MPATMKPDPDQTSGPLLRKAQRALASEGLRRFSKRTGIPLTTVFNWSHARSLRQISAYGFLEFMHHTATKRDASARKPNTTTRRG